MSWLLVALTPGLLILATLGLDRVESSLQRDVITAADVADLMEANERDSATGGLIDHIPAANLPTHQYFHDRPNPEFQQTRQMNPV
ncbi:MAG: hypothetical protein ACPGVY_16540 [Mycobacterium sp.]